MTGCKDISKHCMHLATWFTLMYVLRAADPLAQADSCLWVLACTGCCRAGVV